MINSYDKITDQLYVGDVTSPRIQLQKKENISHIISLVPLDKTLKKILKKKSINHFEYYFPENRDENIIQHFKNLLPKILNILSQDSTKLLIHCQIGRSRSVGIIILILMKIYKYSFEDAITLVKSKRDIGMNPNFYETVKNYKI